MTEGVVSWGVAAGDGSVSVSVDGGDCDVWWNVWGEG